MSQEFIFAFRPVASWLLLEFQVGERRDSRSYFTTKTLQGAKFVSRLDGLPNSNPDMEGRLSAITSQVEMTFVQEINDGSFALAHDNSTLQQDSL